MLKYKKSIAIILSIIMVFTNISIGIIAQEGMEDIAAPTLVEQAAMLEEMGGIATMSVGVGSEDIPFEISKAAQLEELSRLVAMNEYYWNFTKRFADASYILTSDIDLSNYSSGEGWVSIGTENIKFGGKFNGDGHVISNLVINRPNGSYQGLFGAMNCNDGSAATIEQLGVVDCNIIAKSYVGGIAGEGNIIKNCYVTGNIKSGNSEVSSQDCTGGIAGTSEKEISNCYTVVNITGNEMVAGITSWNYMTAQNCVALGESVSGTSNVARAVLGNSMTNIYAWEGMQATGAIDNPTKITGEALRGADPICWKDWDEGIWNISEGYLPTFKNSTYKGYMPEHLSADSIAGDGTEASPYQIGTAAELALIRDKINAGTSSYADVGKFFKLTADIDLLDYTSGEGWVSIGNDKDTTFKGTFDGGGYVISNLTINKLESHYQGLFGNSIGVIKNIGLENVNIIGKEFTGGIVGHTIAEVNNCYVKGNINGYTHVGGIAGYSNNTIKDCYAEGTIIGTSTEKDEVYDSVGGVGGIVGRGQDINNCYSNSTVGAVEAAVGGIAGKLSFDRHESSGSMKNCVAVGSRVKRTGTGIGQVGRVLGEIVKESTIESCYANKDMELNDNTLVDPTGATDNINGEDIDLAAVRGNTTWWRGLAYTKDSWLIKTDGYPFLRVFDKENTVPDFALKGTGTSEEPYQINDIDDLVFMRKQVNEGIAVDGYVNRYFKMTKDIDISKYCQGEGWIPIGDKVNQFKGIFDGDGYKITGLSINRPKGTEQGLFGDMPSGKIQNLGIIDAKVIGLDYVGIIAGFAANIENCYSSGYVQAKHILGGIAGFVNAGAEVQNCYSTATVKGEQAEVPGEIGKIGGVGGIIGHSKGNIEKCYYAGEVTGHSQLGGITGYIEKDKTVSNCIMLGNRIVTFSNARVNRILGARTTGGMGTGVKDSYSWEKTKMLNNEIITSVDTNSMNGKNIASDDIYEQVNWGKWIDDNGVNWEYTTDKLPKLKIQKDIAMDIPIYLIKDEAFSVKAGAQLLKDGFFTFPDMEINSFPDKTINDITIQLTSGYQTGDSIAITPAEGFTITSNGPYMVKVAVNDKKAKEIQGFLKTNLKINVAKMSESHERTIKFTMSDKDILNENIFYNETNGHYYEYVFGEQKTWNEAYIEASAKTYMGENGYLATISNKAENDFVSQFMNAHGWLGATSDSEVLQQSKTATFDGGNGNAYDNSYADTKKSQGKFYWVTGDEKGQKFWQQTANRPEYVWNEVDGRAIAYRYENWKRNAGKLVEPNDYYNKGERYLYMNKGSGTWSDYTADAPVYGYVVEYNGKNQVLAGTKIFNCLTKINPGEPKINDIDEEIAYSDIPVLPEIVDSGYVLPKIGANGSSLVWSGTNSDLTNNGENIITVYDLKCTATYNGKEKNKTYSINVRPIAGAETPIVLEKADDANYLKDINITIDEEATKYGVYPNFNKDLYTYTILIPKGTSDVDTLKMNTTKEGEGIVGITGDNIKKIITHTINEKVSTYTVNIVKAYIPIVYDYSYTGDSIKFSNALYGSGGYKYSVDNGVNWQLGTTFSVSKPGLYSIKVKDDIENITEAIEVYIDGTTEGSGKGGFEANVQSITLNRSNLNMPQGQQAQLIAEVKPLNAIDTSLTWESNNKLVATIASNGVVTAVADGEATITATSKDGQPKKAECTVNVASIYTMELDVDKATFADLDKGYTNSGNPKTVKITNTGNQAINLNDIKATNFIFTSFSKNPLPVEQYTTFEIKPKLGLEVGKYSEKIEITATSGAKGTFIAEVTVKPVTIPVTGINISPTKLEIVKGETSTLVANVLPNNASNKKVIWSSENEAIATVTDAGVVNAIETGETKIKAKTEDGTITATCNITVKGQDIKHNIIEGEIIDSQNNPMDNIKIELMYKNTKKAKTITQDGHFMFNEKLSDGIYLLVIKNNAQITTETVLLEKGKADKQIIVLKNGNMNTVIENTGKAPQASIDNMSDIFEDEKCFDNTDNEVINNKGTIEFKLVVDEAKIAEDKAKILEKSKEIKANIGYYSDIKIVKTINDLPEEIIEETDNDITLIMEIPENLKGKTKYNVIRVHNGIVTVLDDIDASLNTVTFKTKLFSTYAVVYMQDAEEPGGNPGGGGGGAAPGIPLPPVVVPPPVVNLGGDDLPYYMRNGKKVIIGFSDMVGKEMTYIAPDGVEILYMKNPQNFKDIEDNWASEAIKFVTQREISKGTTPDYFSPNVKMTRAMFITLIGRLYENSYGEIPNIEQSIYKDVPNNMYYAKYVEWASKNNITKGLTEEVFGVNEEVTREQMATTMYRLAKHMNKAPSGNWAIKMDYEDLGSMSDWALEGAMYCKLKGVITGKDGNYFRGKDTANRAEVSTVIARFVKSILTK